MNFYLVSLQDTFVQIHCHGTNLTDYLEKLVCKGNVTNGKVL